MRGNSTGNNNTAIGYEGYYSTGNSNTVVGRDIMVVV